MIGNSRVFQNMGDNFESDVLFHEGEKLFVMNAVEILHTSVVELLFFLVK